MDLLPTFWRQAESRWARCTSYGFKNVWIMDYRAAKHRRRRDQWKIRALQVFLLDLSEELLMFTIVHVKIEHYNVMAMIIRSTSIMSVRLNLNGYSEHQCMIYVMFKSKPLHGWPDWSTIVVLQREKKYRCDSLTATCSTPHWLALYCRLNDLEMTYGMSAGQIGKILWDVIEVLKHNAGNVPECRGIFLKELSELYTIVIAEAGAMI